MKTLILAALALAALAGPALAEIDCTGEGPMLPMWQVAKTFEEQGGVIQAIRLDDGCYEIDGREGDAKVEIDFDPWTGAELEDDED